MSDKVNIDNMESLDKKDKKKKTKNPVVIFFLSIIAFIILFFGLITFFNSMYIVDETHTALVTRFGNIRKVIMSEKEYEFLKNNYNLEIYKDIEIVTRKGLFFKTPMIDTIKTFDNRLLTYDTATREVTSMDKKRLLLDNNAQWKIVNPILFNNAVRDSRRAHTILDDILFSKMNEKIGQTDSHVLISDKEYVNNLLDNIAYETNEEIISQYGLKVIDVRIKRTDLPPENNQNIFNRMKTEREQKAKEYRSEGKEKAQEIRSAADKTATIIEAEAYTKAQTIRGEGDAEATKIYNEAYNTDPEFYEFYRTLQTYKNTLDEQSKIIIDANSPFMKYLLGNTK